MFYIFFHMLISKLSTTNFFLFKFWSQKEEILYKFLWNYFTAFLLCVHKASCFNTCNEGPPTPCLRSFLYMVCWTYINQGFFANIAKELINYLANAQLDLIDNYLTIMIKIKGCFQNKYTEIKIFLRQLFFKFSGPVDNKTVAARYQGSPGGKLTTGGKKKQEPFGMLIINLNLKWNDVEKYYIVSIHISNIFNFLYFRLSWCRK